MFLVVGGHNAVFVFFEYKGKQGIRVMEEVFLDDQSSEFLLEIVKKFSNSGFVLVPTSNLRSF